MSHVQILIMTSQIWQIMESIKIKKLENILRTEHNFSIKQKNYQPVPQITHSENLSFFSGGNPVF